MIEIDDYWIVQSSSCGRPIVTATPSGHDLAAGQRTAAASLHQLTQLGTRAAKVVGAAILVAPIVEYPIAAHYIVIGDDGGVSNCADASQVEHDSRRNVVKKEQKQQKKALKVSAQTIRSLDYSELNGVAGGSRSLTRTSIDFACNN